MEDTNIRYENVQAGESEFPFLSISAYGAVATDIGRAIVEAGKIHREVWPTWLRAIHDELVK